MKAIIYTRMLAIVVMLAGCATGTEGPPDRCMIAAKQLEDVKAGDDIIQKHAELRRDYGRETSKLRCMQSHSRALLGK